MINTTQDIKTLSVDIKYKSYNYIFTADDLRLLIEQNLRCIRNVEVTKINKEG